MESHFTKEQFEESGAWGLLTTIDLKDCDPALISDSEKIQEYVVKACEMADVKRYGDTQVVHFGEDPKVSGYTFTQLIETSLLSGHFAEIDNSAYIDLFSCKFYEQKELVEFTKEFFGAKEVKSNIVLRK
jgi:S-adenosylmethionine/arginine decarboxylase-like enzyme